MMGTAEQLGADLAPDEATIRAFLAETVRESIQLVSIAAIKGGAVEGRCFDMNAKTAAIWAAAQNRMGKNVYWSPNCVTPGLNKKAKKGDILTARFVMGDADFYKVADPSQAQIEARRKLQGLATPPSFVLNSGNGEQPFWRLRDANPDHAAVERVNAQARVLLGGDAVQNIDRVMRLPGTVNYPNEKKLDLGLVPVMASVAAPDLGASYWLEEISAALDQFEARSGGKLSKNDCMHQVVLMAADDLGLEDMSPLRSVIEKPVGLDRSGDVLRCAGDMKREGYSKEQVLAVLMNPANGVSAHVLAQADPRRAALKAITKAFGDRPLIHVRAGELHLMATEAETALIDSSAPIFIRGGLVRPIVEELPAAHGMRTQVARLAPVDADMLRDQLSRAADWVKHDGRSKSNKPVDPPRDVATTILGRDGEWRLRPLAGVITTPTLRPDGTILSLPGYDVATRLLLCKPPVLPDLSERPTKNDAERALALLRGLLADFPFVDEPSRAVALSMLITPIVRGAMSVAPLHVATAPVAGSGKSYLVDIASTILSGERAPVIAAGRTEEETEKRLGAALLLGQAIVSIDNVNGNLGGDMLCQMIERPRVAVRPLGVSKLIHIESRSTTFATGNNIKLVEDMTRRAIVCSLDPNVERPELREFTVSPVDTVLADRGRYVAAALTVVRAYIVAGCPRALPALASFEEWSRLVRSALVWLGEADPVMTMESARAGDPATAGLRTLLHVWDGAVGQEGLLAKELRERAEGLLLLGDENLHRALLEVAQGHGHSLDTRKLAGYLSKFQGRIVDGLKLIGDRDSHAKQIRWRVSRVAQVDAGAIPAAVSELLG